MTGRLAFGIDLGGTQIRVALVDDSGRVLRRAAMPTDVAGGPKGVLAQIQQMADEIGHRSESHRVAGIGISAPGPLDSVSGTVIDIPTLPGWQGFPLRDAASKLFELPVVLENDGIAAAFGEWKFGAGRGLQHMVYVTVSTGIGGGVVVDNRLIRGRRGMAAHVGHMKLAQDGPRCSCGALGCFEAFAAGTALGAAARAAVRSNPGSVLARSSDFEKLTAVDVVAAAREGDTLACQLMDQEAQYLGIGFTALLHLYSPEMIVMGGGVSQAFDLLQAGIDAVIQHTAMAPYRDAKVVQAELKDNAGIVGAAGLVFAN